MVEFDPEISDSKKAAFDFKVLCNAYRVELFRPKQSCLNIVVLLYAETSCVLGAETACVFVKRICGTRI